MPPFGGITSPPCTSWIILMIEGAAASLPAWGSPLQLSVAPTSKWLFFPGLPKWSLEIVLVWTPELWMLITLRLELGSRRSLNQSCSSPRELSNDVSHFTCTHRNRVDSWLLVVGSQIANLTFGPFFDHNLCCRCPNGSCEAILDIYASRPFQLYKECLNARCFDPYNRALNFWESWRTPKSHFQECEWRPHNSLKVGLRHNPWQSAQPRTVETLDFGNIPQFFFSIGVPLALGGVLSHFLFWPFFGPFAFALQFQYSLSLWVVKLARSPFFCAWNHFPCTKFCARDCTSLN
jgi:hypothetical protein